ncbi:hypothetical protein LDENG_00212370 [Lucifuga dentata]|nr:hypothetical protein LDENG_00212370 [Lucifuga dentata]
MAESRRVQLTALSPDVFTDPNKPALVQTSSPFVLEVKQKSSLTPADTVRCVLTLFESDERNFPEFSYCGIIENKGDRPKKKKDLIQDLVDIGYGYDEEDSFIDNSEAYDEFVPACITTKYGGFYINSGLLQFRQISDTETEDNTTERETTEPSKKCKLNSRLNKPKKKRYREDGQMENNMEAKTSTLSKTGVDEPMKKKRTVSILGVSNMQKKFQNEKERQTEKMERKNQKAAALIDTPTIPPCPADVAGGGVSRLTDPLLSLIGSTNDHALIQAASTVDFLIDLDSLLDVTKETILPNSPPQPATEKELIISSQPKPDHCNQSRFSVHTQAQPPKSKMKSNAQAKPHPQLNLPESKSVSLQSVPLLEGIPAGLEGSIVKLMVVRETEECNEAQQNVEKAVKKGPKKLFRWSEEIRECLCHVVRVKMDRYEMERKESEEVEEYLKTFLDNEVKQLWPKGWMQSRFKLTFSLSVCPTYMLRVKKVKTEKKQSFISDKAPVPNGSGDSAESKSSLKGLSLKKDGRFNEGLIFSSLPQSAVEEMSALKVMEDTLREAEVMDVESSADRPPLVNSTSAPSHSLLDLLAEQALARQHLLTHSISQELLEAAVAKYNHSAWPLCVEMQSPPLPPSLPHSSPADFPGNRECLFVLPRMLQVGDFTGDATTVQSVSEDADISIIT